MMTRVRKLQKWSAYEWLLLAQALVLLPLTRCSFLVLGVRRWHRVLTKLSEPGVTFSGSSPPGLESTEHAETIARIVRIAAYHGFYRANCLPQALVLWFLLRRTGIDGIIRFGARKEVGELQGHAWVEAFGKALNETDDVHDRFSPFEDFRGCGTD